MYKCICIVCDTELENFSNKTLHPNDGLAFYTNGHYGSTVFDPMDGSYMSIVVCDTCIKNYDYKMIEEGK